MDLLHDLHTLLPGNAISNEHSIRQLQQSIDPKERFALDKEKSIQSKLIAKESKGLANLKLQINNQLERDLLSVVYKKAVDEKELKIRKEINVMYHDFKEKNFDKIKKLKEFQNDLDLLQKKYDKYIESEHEDSNIANVSDEIFTTSPVELVGSNNVDNNDNKQNNDESLIVFSSDEE